MKVVHLTTVHPPFDIRIFHKQAKTLVRAGYEVTLIAQHEKNDAVDGVKIIALPKAKKRFVRIISLTWRAFRLSLRQRAVIYHFHDPELLPIGVLLKLVTRAKVIYDVHEDYPQHMLCKEWLPKPCRRFVSKLVWGAEKLFCRYFDAIVTPTDSITDRFQQLRARRAITLHNFPSLDSLTRESRNSNLGICKFSFIHVGTLSAPRFSFIFSVALELRKMGSEAKWCILGASQELIKWAKDRLFELNLVDNFSIIEWVSYDEVRKYLCQSRIGINHHLAEPRFLVAIPAKVLEYMAYGLPVISSDLPLLRKLLGDEKCAFLVEPGGVREFAISAKYMLDNLELAERMGSIGKKLIREKYNWEKEGEKLVKLYYQLLETAK